MALRRRSIIAIGVFVLLAVVVAAGHWYETQRVQPGHTTDKTQTVHVTNAGDRGPGTLREALFIVAAATGPSLISVEIPSIKLETALPALVNGRGVRIAGQAAGTVIDAQALNAGPVFDVSGPNTSIEGITVSQCPAAAILVRSVHFKLSTSTIQSCDVGVEVAENASDTLIERNHFTKNRVGIRFAASGHNTAVANNEFKEHKDAGLWAVRSARDSHDDVIGIHDNKFRCSSSGTISSMRTSPMCMSWVRAL
jgi:parallel beta-helix repeat protein